MAIFGLIVPKQIKSSYDFFLKFDNWDHHFGDTTYFKTSWAFPSEDTGVKILDIFYKGVPFYIIED